MKSLQIARLFCEDLAHPVFGSGRQHPTEMSVYATDGADRIASELDIREIENAFRREAISFADEFCERRGPVAYCFRADLNRIGGIHTRQARLCEARRMRRCISAFVGGEGSITSQVSGARFAGSAESKVCKNVVPVRGNPTTKRGARIWCCAISGCRLRSRCSKSRLRRMRRTSERSAMFPITFRRASRQHDSSRRASGSRKSPSPKSSRLARRFATHPPVSSLLYGNGKSDFWRGLFLGSRRNLSQIDRCCRHGGWLRRWQQR